MARLELASSQLRVTCEPGCVNDRAVVSSLEIAREKNKTKNNRLRVIERFRLRWANMTSARAYDAWVSMVETRHSLRELIRRALSRMMHALLARGFDSWMALANEACAAETEAANAARQLKRDSAMAVIARWRSNWTCDRPCALRRGAVRPMAVTRARRRVESRRRETNISDAVPRQPNPYDDHTIDGDATIIAYSFSFFHT